MLSITAISGLQISEPLGRGFQIQNDLFLTNDQGRIRTLLSPALKEGMGRQEYDFIVKNGLVLYSKAPTDIRSETADAFVVMWLKLCRLFVHSLWFIRDNSADCDVGYLEYSTAEQIHTYSNSIKAMHSTAHGLRLTVAYSLSELREARKICVEHLLPLVFEQAVKGKGSHPQGKIISSKGIPRLLRAQFFCQGARSEQDIGIKMSLYMTCLEILFSNDSAELAHKLSERVACFLEQMPAKRKELFSTVKRAYNVRSKVVHGDVVTPKIESEMRLMSERIDHILRLVFRQVLADSETRKKLESNNDERETYFEQLVLG